MSSPKNKLSRILLISLAAFFSFILISLIVVSKVIVPKEIRNYIKEFSEDTGVRIEAKDIGFDLLSGIKVEKIQVYDLSEPTNPFITVGTIGVKPNILSSLINRKIVVRIKIDEPVVSSDKAGLDKITELIKKKREETGKDKKKVIPIEIQGLSVTDGRVQIPSHDSVIFVKKIEVALSDGDRTEERAMKLSGLLSFRDNNIRVRGKIKPFQNTPFGELNINAPELNMGLIADSDVLSEKLTVSSNIRFQIGDAITSQGVVNLRQAKSNNGKNYFSGKAEYDLSYNTSSDTISFDSISLNLVDLLRLSLAGHIEDFGTERFFDLKGEIENVRLENIFDRFGDLSPVKFSGDVEPIDIKIIGSEKDKNVSLSGTVGLSGVDVRDDRNRFQISGLGGNLDFKKVFQGGLSEGLSAQGSFFIPNVLTEIGELNGVSGKVELVSDDSSEEKLVNFSSLRASFPDGLVSGDAQLRISSPENKIIVESDDLHLENFSFEEFKIRKGNISNLLFKSEGNGWTLDLSGTGFGFQMLDSEVGLQRFQTRIHAEKNGRISVRGSLSGEVGKFKEISFPVLSTNFDYADNLLELTDLITRIEDYGELRAGQVGIRFGEQENRAYEIAFSEGSFYGFDDRIKSDGIKGGLFFYGGEEKLEGSVSVSETDVFKSRLNDLSLQVIFSEDEIKLENISGKIFSGDLEGDVIVTTTEPKSYRLISSDFKLRNASIPSDKFPMYLESLNFSFTGNFGENLFPQGGGQISFAGLRIGEDGASSPLMGRMEFETGRDETLFEGDGFIENSEWAKINFSTKLEDISNEKIFYFSLPETSLTPVQSVLSPVLPEFLREGDVRGTVGLGLSLILNSFSQQDISWNGRIHIKDAFLKTELSGTPFSINNINGDIRIRDDTRIENSLASFVRNGWKLEREEFGAFLDTADKITAEDREYLLRIQEIEYGFLKLGDIECLIELDESRVGLKWLELSLYDGRMFGKGFFDFGSENDYGLSLLFKDISLKNVSGSVSVEDYITGRTDGLLWLSGNQGALNTLDGSFNFWTMESEKEPRSVGKALLQKLGVRERFLLGSSRRYDRGEIYGYIINGVITFKELLVSNGILGIRDLFIKVDEKRNSISVSHLLSVIRETAKRAAEGGLEVEIKR